MRDSDKKDNVTFFRAGNRFFRAENQWFYTTREGDEGPFKSQEEAQRHLQAYIDLQQVKHNAPAERLTLQSDRPAIDPKIWDRHIDVL